MSISGLALLLALTSPAVRAQTPPKAYRVGVLHPGSQLLRGWDKALRELGYVEGQNLVVERRYAEGKTERLPALAASPVHNQDRKQLIWLAARHRLPSVWEWRQHAEEGGLLSYGANSLMLDGRVASYVDRLLRGANPAELPVEQPTVFELVVNTKTAKSLGLTIPSLLLRADKVIE